MSKYKEMNEEIKLSDGEKERLIADLSAAKTKNRRPAGLIAAAAVCLLAVLGVFAVKYLPKTPETTPSLPGESEQSGVYVPKTEIDVNEASLDSMVMFIVYNGRVYMGGGFVYNGDDVEAKGGVVWDEYADISQKLRYRHVPFTVTGEEFEALKGEFLGTCTDTPDICTSEEDRERVRKAFEDPSGESFFGMEGDYYTVNGIPREKCICLVTEFDGCRTLHPLYCLNGITLASGKDVFGDLLDIKNAKKIQWVTDDEWNEGLDETVYYHDGETPGDTALRDLAVPGEIWGGFIDELYASVPVVRSEETFETIEKDMYDVPSGHLYVTLANGLVVKLRLFENGYVSCDCSYDLLFKLEGENWKRILETVR